MHYGDKVLWESVGEVALERKLIITAFLRRIKKIGTLVGRRGRRCPVLSRVPPIFSRELGLMEFNTRNDQSMFPEGSLLLFGNKLGEFFLTLVQVSSKTKDSSTGMQRERRFYGWQWPGAWTICHKLSSWEKWSEPWSHPETKGNLQYYALWAHCVFGLSVQPTYLIVDYVGYYHFLRVTFLKLYGLQHLTQG